MESENETGIEMPKPTAWPMVLSLGMVLLGAGLALGTLPFLVLGGLLFVLSLVGWFGELLPGQGYELEALTHPLPGAIKERPGTVEQLKPGVRGYRFRLPEKVHPISAGLKGGIVGGFLMTIPALAWGSLSGHGIWFPVNLLAGLVFPGVDSYSEADLEQYRPSLILFAIAVHAIMSLTIGFVYGVLLPTIPGQAIWHIFLGGAVLPLIWTGFSYGAMGIANPLLARHVDWYWFALSQLVFGLAAALVVTRTEKVATEQAGGPT